jgi:peptidase M41-like protein
MARAIYGMDEKLGLMAYESERALLLPGAPEFNGEHRYSEASAREIDRAVREALRAAFEGATAVLTRGRRVLERGARSLLEQESLGKAELQPAASNPFPGCLSVTHKEMARRVAAHSVAQVREQRGILGRFPARPPLRQPREAGAVTISREMRCDCLCRYLSNAWRRSRPGK